MIIQEKGEFLVCILSLLREKRRNLMHLQKDSKCGKFKMWSDLEDLGNRQKGSLQNLTGTVIALLIILDTWCWPKS